MTTKYGYRIANSLPFLLFAFALVGCGADIGGPHDGVSSKQGAPQDSIGTVRSGTGNDGTSQLKIMPLGDSITWGWNTVPASASNNWQSGTSNDGGYRAPLWQALSAKSSVTFVGTNPNIISPGDPSGMPSGNEGHPGWTTAELLSGRGDAGRADQQSPNGGKLDTWLSAKDPDLVLLMVGTNDRFHSITVEQSSSNVRQIIEKVLGYRTVKYLFVASIIGCRDLDCDNSTLNEAIKSVVSEKQNLGMPLSFVDMATESDLKKEHNDFSDDIHPADAGYQKIANVWKNHIASKVASLASGQP